MRLASPKSVASILATALMLTLSSAANASLTDGLISYWNFNETTGSVASDTAGYANVHDATEQPSGSGYAAWPGDDSEWVPGKFGNALSFSNASQAVSPQALGNDGPTHDLMFDVPNSPRPSFSVSGWIKPATVTGSSIIFYNGLNSAYGSTWGLFLGPYEGGAGSASSLNFYFWDAGGYPHVSSSALSADTWYQYAVTYDSSSSILTMYLDGASVSSTTGTINTISHTLLQFGGDLYRWGYNGLMDDTGVWDRALTSTEVSDIWNGGAGAPIVAEEEGPSGVPEPSTFVLAAMGLFGLGLVAWRKRRG